MHARTKECCGTQQATGENLRRSTRMLRQTLHTRTPHLGVSCAGCTRSGTTIQEILEEYPQLTREDVPACVAYGAEMSRERFVDVPLERPA